MTIVERDPHPFQWSMTWATIQCTKFQIFLGRMQRQVRDRVLRSSSDSTERGDVPGWVLVVLMTTGLVTAIWMIAAPRLTAILRNSLDSMNGIR